LPPLPAVSPGGEQSPFAVVRAPLPRPGFWRSSSVSSSSARSS
jgi:hypothetical protein